MIQFQNSAKRRKRCNINWLQKDMLHTAIQIDYNNVFITDDSNTYLLNQIRKRKQVKSLLYIMPTEVICIFASYLFTSTSPVVQSTLKWAIPNEITLLHTVSFKYNKYPVNWLLFNVTLLINIFINILFADKYEIMPNFLEICNEDNHH